MSPEMSAELWALAQVIFADVIFAGDNAVVVGVAAAGLPAERRRQAIFWGIAAATVLRIVFSLIATQLLQIVGLLLAGGVLLLWVSWRLWRELRSGGHEGDGVLDENAPPADPAAPPPKTFKEALTQIVLADVSMSLDNVLAVAGIARENMMVLVVGLMVSVALMGLAASLVANVLQKHRWVSYLGLVLIIYIAMKMIWDGAHQVAAVAGG